MKYLLVSIFIAVSFCTFGHNRDTVFMKNDHVLIGEIKIMDNGILTIETDYSKKDFQVEWDEVERLHTKTSFIIMMTTKARIIGRIASDPFNPEYMIITPLEGSKNFAKLIDIVYLKSTDNNFWDRISANVDGGVNITKASNTKQYSASGKASYLYTKLSSDVYVNYIGNVTQDTIRSRRNNYGTNWRFFLKQSWYILGAADFLESDEQNLALRTTVQSGVGKFILRNYKMSLSSAMGLAANFESYLTVETPNQNTLEGFVEAEFNIYDMKDLYISSKAQFFPSISKEQRARSILTFDIKLDLPFDFYIGLYYTFNYDSSPNENGHTTDYVLQSAIGWKF